MRIQVLFFGATVAITGTRRREMGLSSESTARTVFDKILAEHPRLTGHKLHFSVNQEFATGEEMLTDGDELAVFTAVSGG